MDELNEKNLFMCMFVLYVCILIFMYTYKHVMGVL